MLKTEFKNISLSNCIFNASGPLCSTREDLLKLNNSNTCIVLSKSSTIDLREGNPKPRYYDHDLGSINSMGLPNLGYQFYLDMSTEISKPYFISISGMTLSDTITIVKECLNNNNISGIEINLSCPNIIGKGQLAYDLPKMDEYLKEIFSSIEYDKKNKLVGLKLVPYFDIHIYSDVCDILQKYPIDFITSVNSLGNGLIIDYQKEETVIKPKNGMGGIGGKYIKPIALSNVRNFYLEFQKRNLDIDIIGCGGIETGIDVFEHILAGAKMVQVGTQLYKEGPDVFVRLQNELISILKEKGYKSLSEFRGKLKNIEK